MSKEAKVILIVLAIVLLVWLPIFPVNVVPEVNIRAIDVNGKPVADITVYQDWQHWTFESQNHRDEIISDENGIAKFSAKRIWVSGFKFFSGMFGEYFLGGIAIHASSGPSSHFIATKKFENKEYWGDLYFCYGSCREDASREIIVKEEAK